MRHAYILRSSVYPSPTPIVTPLGVLDLVNNASQPALNASTRQRVIVLPILGNTCKT